MLSELNILKLDVKQRSLLINKCLSRTSKEENGCWIWNGAANPYGIVAWKGDRFRLHRLSHLFFIGPIPIDRPHVMHLCQRPRCWNPAHIKAATNKENMQYDLKGKFRTHCPRGHAMTKDNVSLMGQQRYCKICLKSRARSYYYRDLEKTHKYRHDWYMAHRKLKPIKRHCSNGHDWIPENWYINKRTGWKSCLICRRLRNNKVILGLES
jgi:hypothetical protein